MKNLNTSFSKKNLLTATSTPTYTNKIPLLVFSHLRWDFVTQRPQHIISRLARTRPVLFVEEPIHHKPEERGTAHVRQVATNIQVLQPRIDANHLIDELAILVRDFLTTNDWEAPLIWFYSAAFGDLADRLPHRAIIYDCMDELSAFKGAPPALIQQEKELIARADVVFTGGKSLYEAKKQWSDSVYCYPSSVDAPHFEQALDAQTIIPADIQSIAHPIVGYYGVIDERIDYELLAQVARQNPQVSLVMIGPVVKVNPADLPQAEKHPLSGWKNLCGTTGLSKGFRHRDDAFCLERIDSIYQSNQNVGIHSGTKAHYFYAYLRRSTRLQSGHSHCKKRLINVRQLSVVFYKRKKSNAQRAWSSIKPFYRPFPGIKRYNPWRLIYNLL